MKYYDGLFSRFFITAFPRFECEEEEEEPVFDDDEIFELSQEIRNLIESTESNTDAKIVEKLKKNYNKDISLTISEVLSLTKCQNCGGKRDTHNVVFGDVEKTNTCEWCGKQYLHDVAIYFPGHGYFSCVSIEKDILSLKIREVTR